MYANDIKILGNYAYVSTRYEGFRIYDISVPTTMTLVGTGTGVPGYTEKIWPTQTHTYLSLESQGFGVWNTSDVAAPSMLVQVFTIGGVDSLIAKGQYLYLGAHNDGIWVADISDPANPIEVAFAENGGRNQALDIQGTTLFVAGVWSDLCIFDITDPTRPDKLVQGYGDNIRTLQADGNYLYTTAGIVDVTDKKSPTYTSKSPYFFGKYAKYGQNYLLVADTYGSGGIHILDVSSKINPILVTTYESGSAFADVAVVGNTAVAAKDNSIITLDIRDIANPRPLDTITYSGTWYASSLSADGPIVYASGGGDDVIKAFDISNSSDIRLIDKVALPSTASYEAIYSDANYVYTGNKFGAYILSKTESAPPENTYVKFSAEVVAATPMAPTISVPIPTTDTASIDQVYSSYKELAKFTYKKGVIPGLNLITRTMDKILKIFGLNEI